MGLDMWIYEGVKPEEDSVELHPSLKELETLGYRCFNTEYIDDDRLVEDILPICIKRKCTYKGYDWDKMRADYNIPADSHMGGWSLADMNSFSFYDGKGKKYKIEISPKDMEKYSKEFESEFLITKLYELRYFRKEYKVQDDVYNVYHEISGKDIQNCGYHQLTKKMIKKLNKRNELFKHQPLPEYLESLYYHEWY